MRTNREADHKIGWRGRLAAVLLLLAIAYPFSCGPASYCMAPGWMSPPVFDALYWPINMKSTRTNGYMRLWGRIADWHDPDW